MLTPTLTDGVVVLDAFRPEDVSAHLAGEDEELARRFGWWPQRSTEAGVRATIAGWRASWADDGPTRALAMRWPDTAQLVGGSELRLGDDGVASMSWWVFPTARRTGLATRMVTLTVAHAFSSMGIARIEALIEPSNTASRALARRVGFSEEGVLRSRAILAERRTDMVLAALLPGEMKTASAEQP